MVNDDEQKDGAEPEEVQDEAAAEAPARPSPRPPRGPSRRTVSRSTRRSRSARKTSRRRWLFGIGGGAIALMLIAGLFLPSVGNLGRSTVPADSPDEGPLSGTEVPVQPGEIIEPGADHAAYSTLPPTSGPRYAEPAPWGVHEAQIDDETIVRSLEVGAVVFNYSLESEAEVADLRQFVEAQPDYPGCYVVQPYAGVTTGSVTLTAWGWTQEMAGVDRFLMQAFVDDHVNAAPLFVDRTCGAPPAVPTAVPTPDAATSSADTGEPTDTQ